MKIKEFMHGQEVQAQNLVFMVTNVTFQDMKRGGKFGKFTCQDNTGTFNANCFEEECQTIKKGDIVTAYVVKGDFNGATTYTLKTMALAETIGLNLSPEEFDNSFTPKTEYLKGVLKEYYEKLNEKYKAIVDKAFQTVDKDKQFENWPAAVSMHHNGKHGLIFHTTGVLKTAEGMIKSAKEHYSVNVNESLVYASIILHDFFKLKEYAMNENEKGVATKYAILGHIVMITQFIGYLYYAGEIDEETYLQMTHVLAAHHGKLDYGSPVVPATVEALIVNKADDFDAKLYMLKDEYSKLEDGELAPQKNYGLETYAYKPVEE